MAASKKALDDEIIRKLINQFVKMVKRVGFEQVIGEKIALLECENGWALTNYSGGLKLGTIGAYVPSNSKDVDITNIKLVKVSKVFTEIPPSDEKDETDTLINLTLHLSHGLNQYSSHVRTNSVRTPEQRKASAKKAIEARWAKYRAEKAKEVEGE